MFPPTLPRDPAVASPSPFGTVGDDIVAPVYTETQDASWRELFGIQGRLAARKACRPYLEARREFERFGDAVPSLRAISAHLEASTGWRVVKAEGYVPPSQFHRMLADKLFPSMDEFRHADELLSTPAPDMFHDLLGHVAALHSPTYASIYRDFGRVGANAHHDEQHLWLQKIYVYAMEYGVVREGDGVRACGGALLTSPGELEVFDGDALERTPWEWDDVLAADLNVYESFTRVFVLPDLEWFHATFLDWARAEKLLD
ncbi:MAG: hypothetical protein VYE22_18140 [Myxococcota bacterium]|nr:hypothetical protein [Myxococcota bacterium]